MFDGTRSTTPASSLRDPLSGASFARSNPQITSIASWFKWDSGLNAVTSFVASSLTVYVRPGTVDPRNGGVNARNRSLVFHEALHGFGGGQPLYLDQGLMRAFNLTGPTSKIFHAHSIHMQMIGTVLRFVGIVLATICLSGLLGPVFAQERRAGTLVGRVADFDGCPLAGVEISVIDASGSLIQTAKTDARGEFRITDLKTGRATLRAEHIGFETSERTQSLHPGVNVWDTGLVLGTLAPSRPHRISGMVRGSKGGAIADATVTISDVFTGAVKEQVRTDSRGQYAFETRDTRQYVLVVTAPSYITTSTTAANFCVSRERICVE